MWRNCLKAENRAGECRSIAAELLALRERICGQVIDFE